MAKNCPRTRKKPTKQNPCQVIRIDVLPDDVLLEIFDFNMIMDPSYRVKTGIEAWQSLVHVCRRWRNLVFGSPHRLNLRLYCTQKTPAKDTLGVWPALPLIVKDIMALSSGTHNIIAALEQSNRVCQVILYGLADWQLEEVLAEMQVPFPELTKLVLTSPGEMMSVIPDSFLGGSAPLLRHFDCGIPFPGLPKLLSSSTHLVYLTDIILHSVYISPETMVALLSVLSSLETLVLKFEFPRSRPDWETRLPPSSKRSVIPALTCFHFKGVIEYLEDLVTFIDAPQLNYFYITFFNPIDFDTPRLAQFIDRIPTLGERDEVHVQFDDWSTSVALAACSRASELEIEISCREPDRQLSSIAQVCNSSTLPPSTVEDLYIENRFSELVWKNDAIENTIWLELLLPFTTVKNLYLSKEFASGVAAALQELVGGGIAEVLPNLQNIFVEGFGPWGPFQENIGQFAAARRHSGHPIDISVWDNDSDMESI